MSILSDKTELYLGPPGTGKTTKLLNIVDELLAANVHPTKIAFLTFTKKAATEAKERAVTRFRFNSKELPWFRTIHSLAFHQAGIGSNRLMKCKDYLAVADACGFEYQMYEHDDDLALVVGSAGNQLFALENLARVTEKSLEDTFATRRHSQVGDEFTLDDLTLIRNTLIRYKMNSGLVDFTDSLTMFINSGAAPPVDVLIVDEAQDLSSLQWKAVEKVAGRANRVIVAGDDDQAVYRWAGADVDKFLGLEGRVEVLPQSYRIPKAVHTFAETIVSRISHRRDKRFDAKDAQGSVEFISDEEDLDAAVGTWLFLARHRYQLPQLERLCRDRGWFYHSKGQNSNSTENARAVVAWENLRRGHTQRCEDVSLALRLAGYKAEGERIGKIHPEMHIHHEQIDAPISGTWLEKLVYLNEGDREYFIQARRGGESLAKAHPETRVLEPTAPRIEISTIHGAKGGEAQGVYLLSDVSESTFNALENGSDDEHRVFYVGATRAIEKLVIRRPFTRYAYDMPEER